MKIVIVGGTGLIGSKLTPKLKQAGHEVVVASPSTGVNTLTGEGLAEALQGAQVIVDVTNSPSWEDQAVLDFFTTSTKNLLKYGADAGVGHLVALSVVGTDRLSDSGFFRAKIAQEKLIRESNLPYTIVHAPQFFEFVKGIADMSTKGNEIYLAPVLIQPMAAEDVATEVGRVSVGAPANGMVEVGGPEKFRLNELIRLCLKALGDSREIVIDPNALYSGARLSERTLIPEDDAKLGAMRFEEWIAAGNLKK